MSTTVALGGGAESVKSGRGVWFSLAPRLSLECVQVKEDVIQPYRAPHEPVEVKNKGTTGSRGLAKVPNSKPRNRFWPQPRVKAATRD